MLVIRFVGKRPSCGAVYAAYWEGSEPFALVVNPFVLAWARSLPWWKRWHLVMPYWGYDVR